MISSRIQGWYLPEAAHPYYVLAPYAKIDFAAPAGPNPPVDKGSVEVRSVVLLLFVNLILIR